MFPEPGDAFLSYNLLSMLERVTNLPGYKNMSIDHTEKGGYEITVYFREFFLEANGCSLKKCLTEIVDSYKKAVCPCCGHCLGEK